MASRGRVALIALGAGVGVLVLFVVTIWLLLAVTDDGPKILTLRDYAEDPQVERYGTRDEAIV